MREIRFDFPRGPDNPRNSEDAFLVTKDGRIDFFYSRYTGATLLYENERFCCKIISEA